jgi:hypothetical protein
MRLNCKCNSHCANSKKLLLVRLVFKWVPMLWGFNRVVKLPICFAFWFRWQKPTPVLLKDSIMSMKGDGIRDLVWNGAYSCWQLKSTLTTIYNYIRTCQNVWKLQRIWWIPLPRKGAHCPSQTPIWPQINALSLGNSLPHIVCDTDMVCVIASIWFISLPHRNVSCGPPEYCIDSDWPPASSHSVGPHSFGGIDVIGWSIIQFPFLVGIFIFCLTCLVETGHHFNKQCMISILWCLTDPSLHMIK